MEYKGWPAVVVAQPRRPALRIDCVAENCESYGGKSFLVQTPVGRLSAPEAVHTSRKHARNSLVSHRLQHDSLKRRACRALEDAFMTITKHPIA